MQTKRYLLVLITCALMMLTCKKQRTEYVCEPCSLPCDELVFSEPGICPECNMNLIHKDEKLVLNEIKIKKEKGKILLEGGYDKSKNIIVHYYKPHNFSPDSKTIILLPGAGRNAADYLDAWIEASKKYQLLVLSLEYREEDYPGFWSYNLANMIYDVNIENETYKINKNDDAWLFHDFDRIFTLVKNELELNNDYYDLFGHSAGGQLLHRLALFKPNSKANRIIAANSGWYTIPSEEHEFPYGIARSSLVPEQLDFSSNLVIFLGEKDDANETRGHLRRSPEVNVQGSHRFARGQYFYNISKKSAKELQKEFKWKSEIVKGVGHDYSAMSNAAADYLYQTK